jgi:replicative DNA helicase
MSAHDQALSSVKLHQGGFVKIGDVLPGMLEKWEKMALSPDLQGIPCGLSDLDRKLGGFHGSELYVVGGRPGMGKTAWGMRVARGAARRMWPVLQISLEMSKEQLLTREISCASRIDSQRFRTGDLQQNHWVKIVEAGEKIDNLPIWIDDSPRASIKEVQSKIRQFYKKHGRCMVLIDYLDFLEGLKSDRKDLEIGTVTKGLKASAKEHDIPIILFVQLNRNCEKRDNKRPEVRDLRNSGEIEQDADIIAFIYRDEVYDPETENQGVAEFIIRKFRQGEPGTVFLRWIKHRTTFESIAR